MRLEGSCHCRAVRFALESNEPVPFMRCYCSICRKTNGAGGYAINLGGDFRTLEVEGEENIAVYRARLPAPGSDSHGGDSSAGGTGADAGAGDDRTRLSNCERRFCRICGSGLWVYSPDWPDLVHPFASAIDTELPAAPAHTHIMLGSRAAWVPLDGDSSDPRYEAYPEESLADWHARHGFEDPSG